MSQSLFAQFRATQLREPPDSATPDPVGGDVADMSSIRKRSRRAAGIEEEEVEVESASSSFRSSMPHKRPRVARVSALSWAPTAIRTKTGASKIRTYDDDDDELEVDELRATQIVEK
ncbi:hypothetical protein LTR53_003544 [Teratosphaeriaceae sp. CCFEE 6253]|nr:hypothetical protein LTR53_003544 [Teratosphaeriaceae sp. CCFEE 6253]